mgnify:CR=1 FL=1
MKIIATTLNKYINGVNNSEATGNASISTNEEIDIQVFPNPASEKITIKIEDAQQWNLTIVDANSKEINLQEVNSKQQLINEIKSLRPLNK